MSSGGSIFFLVISGLLTGLQEALQLLWADELLPVVRPAGNNAEQLLGHDDAQSEGQVGFINGGDEERTTRLHTDGKKNQTNTSHDSSRCDNKASPGSSRYLKNRFREL